MRENMRSKREIVKEKGEFNPKDRDIYFRVSQRQIILLIVFIISFLYFWFQT